MKKFGWMIIVGIVLICAAIGCSVWGVYRLIYIIKTDPFDDTVRYILKVFGLVGIIFLQIFGYGGGVTLIVLGCIFGSKADKREAQKQVEQQKAVEEIPAERPNDSHYVLEDVRIEGKELHIKDETIDMSTITNVFMSRNEVRIKVENVEYVVCCKDSAQAVQLVSKIKQYSK